MLFRIAEWLVAGINSADMKVAPNPRYEAMVDIIRQQKDSLRPWAEVAFRAATPQYAHSKKLIDGNGAYLHGSRWCAPCAFPCVSLSTTKDISILESYATAMHYGWKNADLQPRVLVSVRLKLDKVFDLVANTSLADKLDLAEIMAEDWHWVNNGGDESLGQALGRAAHDLSVEGFVVPSAQIEDGVNVVVFPEAWRPRSRMEVIGQAKLDRWLKKR